MKKIIIFLILGFAVFGGAKIVFAETPPTLVWQKTYDSGNADYSRGITFDPSGNVYVTGYCTGAYSLTYDCLTIKYDPSGDTIWQKIYNGGGNDYGYGVAVDPSRNVYVAGSYYNGVNSDYLLIKHDSDGETIWQKIYDGGFSDNAISTAVDSSGNVCVTGEAYMSPNWSFRTIKYDSSGNTVLWVKAYAAISSSGAGIVTDDTGNIYVTGTAYDGSQWDFLTIKYDSGGNIIWDKKYNGGPNDSGFGIAVDPCGNVYVTGQSNNGTNYDYFTIKYNSTGDTVWQKRYDSGNNDYGYGIAVDPSGNVYVTGCSGNGANDDYLTIKYNSGGDTIWQKRWDGGSNDYGRGIAVDPSGNVYLTGYSFNGANYDWLVMKYSQFDRLKIASSPFTATVNESSLVVQVRVQDALNNVDNTFNGTVSLTASSLCRQFSSDGIVWTQSGCDTFITLTSGTGQFYYKDSQAGNPVITVSRSGYFSDTQVETVNVPVASEIPPSPVWQKAWDGGSWDEGYGIAVDDTGNVYVTGRSYSGGNPNYLTFKYDTNGNTVWQKVWDGGINDEGHGIAVDRAPEGSGNVYVTGSSWNGANGDYLTIKYNSGSPPGIVWQKAYDGGATDYGYGIAVDSSNNVYVTGFSWNGANYDCLTIKYNSSGDTVWQKLWNGGSNDVGYGIAVDSSGNVYVTGYSNDGANGDYLTIKYNSSGDTVWQKVYNCGNDDVGYGIAVDSSGNVYVTGYSHNGANRDYLTIKYNSIGDTVWQRAYNGGSTDDGRGITVDSSGNVYVTGYSYNGTNGYDYLTIKYNSIGDTVWQKIWNGGPNDFGYGIAVDRAPEGSGNVYVTGKSNDNYLTIKYSRFDKLKITTFPFTATANNPSSSVQVQVQDAVGNIDTAFTETVILSTSSVGGKFSASSTAWADVGYIMLNNGAGIFYYKDLQVGDPIITVSRQYYYSDSQTETIIPDITPPFGSVSITEGDTINTAAVILSLSATDTQSTVDTMVISDGVQTNTFAYATNKAWVFPGDGIQTITVWFIDNAGNISEASYDTVLIDITPPSSCSININTGATYAKTANVTLYLSADDTLTAVDTMVISNTSAFTTANTYTYSNTHSWTLNSEDGTKTVYAKFIDRVKNVSDVYSDTIILDMTNPTLPILMPIPNWTGIDTIALTWSASYDTGTGFNCYWLDRSSEPWTPPTSTNVGSETTFPSTGLLDGHTYWFQIESGDKAGNLSLSNTQTTKVDLSAPDTPALLLPQDGAKLDTVLPVFSWAISNDTGSPLVYHLLISETITFASTVVSETVSTCSYTLLPTQPLFANKKYYWYVIPSDLFRDGLPSSTRNFIVDTEAPIISIISPINGAVVVNDTMTLSGNVSDSTSLNTAILILNGVEKVINADSGVISESVTLNKGFNYLRVKAYDEFSNLGASNEIAIFYADTFSNFIDTSTQEITVSCTAGNVIIPQGAFSETVVIAVTNNPSNDTINYANNNVLVSANFKLAAELVNTICEFNAFKVISGAPSCTQSLNNFAKPVTLKIIYPVGVVRTDFENNLKIYYLNMATREWIVVSGEQIIDKSNRTVSVMLNHFSIYRLFVATFAASNLSNVYVYPNPVKPGSGQKLNFKNLTALTTIRIYNIAGELVRIIEETDGDGINEWNLKNDSSEPVASGVYIYFITNPVGEKTTGKIMVIR